MTRYVFLDPDGMAGTWLYVIVEAPTGVFYQQQYGGTACRLGQVEGFLVPVAAAQGLDALSELLGLTAQPWKRLTRSGRRTMRITPPAR